MFVRETFIFFAFAFAALTNAQDPKPEVSEKSLGKKVLNDISDLDILHPTDFPFLARIDKFGKHRCDGTIVGVNFVLTSAHCVMDSSVFEPDSLLGYQVRVSSILGLAELHYNVKNIYVHYNYLERRLENTANLAMIRTTKNFIVSKRLDVIKIIKREPKEDEIGIVAGFRNERKTSSSLRTEENLDKDEIILDAAKLNVFSLNKCQEVLHLNLNEDKICAGELLIKNDPCLSIGGGPLIVDGHLAGVVNWNIGCKERDRPGVYTSTYYYRDWIYSMIRRYQ